MSELKTLHHWPRAKQPHGLLNNQAPAALIECHYSLKCPTFTDEYPSHSLPQSYASLLGLKIAEVYYL